MASVAIIADNASVYVRWLIADLAKREAAPSWVFIGSAAERLHFAYRSFLRVRRRLGWQEALWRAIDRRVRNSTSTLPLPPEFETLHARLNFEIVHYDHIESGGLLLQLMERNPSLVLLAGCGIVNEALLRIPSQGVLNGHPAILPGARGVDVIEWGILHGLPTGVTAHFAAPSVDAGEIVAQRLVAPELGESWANFKERILCNQAECLAEAAVLVLTRSNRREPNDSTRSRLFFATRREDRQLAELKFLELTKASARLS